MNGYVYVKIANAHFEAGRPDHAYCVQAHKLGNQQNKNWGMASAAELPALPALPEAVTAAR
jgi:hypothetical protein